LEYLLWILRGIAFAILILAAVQDFKNEEVPDIMTGAFCIVASVAGYLAGFHAAAVTALCLTILFLAVPDFPVFGGADGAVYSGLIGSFGFCSVPVVLFIPSVLALIIYLIEGKSKKYKLTRLDAGLSQRRKIVLLPIVAAATPLIAFVLYYWWYSEINQTFLLLL